MKVLFLDLAIMQVLEKYVLPFQNFKSLLEKYVKFCLSKL